MAYDRIALAYVADELLELGPMHVLARRFISETLIEVNSFELAKFLLIEGAHAQVADRLTGPSLPFCQVRFSSFRHLVSQ